MAANDPSVARPDPLGRLRWVLVGIVVLLAAVAAAFYLVGRQSGTTAAMPATPAAADAPAATWAAGERRAPGFSLTDQTGTPVSLASLHGRPVIVTFIDPLCRNFCPIEAQHLNDVVRSFPRGQKPAVVAVSVNVYGNAKPVLMQDERKWKLVPEWRWAVGRSAQLTRVWHNYGIAVLVSTKKAAGVTVHNVAHDEVAYLVDANGFERAVFVWPYRASAVVQALRRLTS
jgi:cytochrome oxidase Cu insertion factor (SCO1/SenC/PrrC family)